MSPEARHASPSRLTAAQRWLAAAAAVLFTGLAGLAFTGMFATVKDEMAPYFGGLAWIVPIGSDAGLSALVLVGLLLEWLEMPMPALAWLARVFIAASVWLNVAAAHGRAVGAVGHAVLPVLFVAFIEAARHAVRRRTGLASGTLRDRVPVTRWLLAPWPTFRLWRRMVLWQVTSYTAALAVEQDRRHAVAKLRAHYAGDWRQDAPDDLVWMLRSGIRIGEACARVTELTSPADGSGAPAGTGSADDGRSGSRNRAADGSRRNRTGTGNRNRGTATGTAAGTGDLDEARRKNDENIAATGKPISGAALRLALGCRKETALDLLRQIKAGTPQEAVNG